VKVRTRRRTGKEPFTGSRRLRWAARACAAGFGSCAAGLLLAMLVGGDRPPLLPWLGGAILFAILPFLIMRVHLSTASDLTPGQKDEWSGAGWGAQPLIVAFYYLLQGGAPLPPGTAKAWGRRR
jgi:hypothetical protein